MKILTIHNKYKFRGGEDESREAEDALLLERGHEVRYVTFDNSHIGRLNVVSVGLRATWSQTAYNRVRDAIAGWRPDLVDVHNFFPLASPSVHYAAAHCRVPVVQTLHNYRLLCPGAGFFRSGRICEKCMGKRVPWPGVLHGCYRGSRPGTLAVAAMVAIHNVLATWEKRVTLFIALTDFQRRKFIEGGLDGRRIVVKPNFVPLDLGAGAGDGDYVLYVGRISVEKGVHVLLEAWNRANCSGRLIIVGDGPLAPWVRKMAESEGSLVYLGRQPLRDVYELMGGARALVFPSMLYEGMPRTIIEAFSRGTPVIASRTGSMTEMVADRETGWLVQPNDPVALAARLREVFGETERLTGMRAAARRMFEVRYTRERNYRFLMDIYDRAILLGRGA